MNESPGVLPSFILASGRRRSERAGENERVETGERRWAIRD